MPDHNYFRVRFIFFPSLAYLKIKKSIQKKKKNNRTNVHHVILHKLEMKNHIQCQTNLVMQFAYYQHFK